MSSDDATAADREKNVVRVSAGRSKFLYADVTKHLLASDEHHVDISALGAAISDAVAVAEMLKNQGMVKVLKISTSRGAEGTRRINTDKIVVRVAKSKKFDELYEEQQAQREARKAEKAEEKE